MITAEDIRQARAFIAIMGALALRRATKGDGHQGKEQRKRSRVKNEFTITTEKGRAGNPKGRHSRAGARVQL
jgi:hypothetical protein